MSDCCDGSECTVPGSALCPDCGQKGKTVQRLTLDNILVPTSVADLQRVEYFFCQTKTCDAVYFTAAGDQTFHKTDLRVRVGIKEREDPVPVCYCFDFTRDDIFEEIRTTGKSRASAYITEQVKAGQCQCEIKNPAGTCCLGEVNRTIKQGMRQETSAAGRTVR